MQEEEERKARVARQQANKTEGSTTDLEDSQLSGTSTDPAPAAVAGQVDTRRLEAGQDKSHFCVRSVSWIQVIFVA